MKKQNKKSLLNLIESISKNIRNNIDNTMELDSKVIISNEDLNDIIFLVRLCSNLNDSNSIPKLAEDFDIKLGTLNGLMSGKRLRFRTKTLTGLLDDIELFANMKLTDDDNTSVDNNSDSDESHFN